MQDFVLSLLLGEFQHGGPGQRSIGRQKIQPNQVDCQTLASMQQRGIGSRLGWLGPRDYCQSGNAEPVKGANEAGR